MSSSTMQCNCLYTSSYQHTHTHTHILMGNWIGFASGLITIRHPNITMFLT